MARPTDDDKKGSSNTKSDGRHRRTRRRRRTLLNLGMPFIQVDDFLNQSEDAVAVGYRVLEETVDEIKKGYKQAQDFNLKQRNWDGKGPAPAIPWEELVERVQGFQNIALRAVRDGTDILSDSVRSGTESLKSMAKTWEQSRDDVDAKPMLAGPVFDETIAVTARAGGDRPKPEVRQIRHRGLTRLRIHAEVDPPLKPLQPTVELRNISRSRTLDVAKVSFEPASENADEEFSLLTVDIGKVGRDQTAAVYEGVIRAKNFELIIAKLRVTVVAAEAPATRPTEAKKRTRAATTNRITTETFRARAITKTEQA